MTATKPGAKSPSNPVPADDRLWPTWKALVAEFRFSRLFRYLVTSPHGFGLYGADVVTNLRRTPMARGAMTVLADVPPDLVDRLQDLASLNARRNEAMWRMSALFYATIPFTLLLAGMEGAPDILQLMLQQSWMLLLFLVGAMTLWLLAYFANNWRARQIEAVVELARIERRER